MKMRLTSKGRYAVRAMLDLTTHSKGNPVRLQEISKRQAISLHYLEQLFRKLRTGSVVRSVRGPGGGYVLSRNMDEISIRDILASVGENINPAKDINGAPSSGVSFTNENGETATVNTGEFHLVKNYFENLGIIMQEYLTTTTLGDLQRKASEINFSDSTTQADSSVNSSLSSASNTSTVSGTGSTTTEQSSDSRSGLSNISSSSYTPNLGTDF
jgi:Rrf2 family iron-sulfur cluster assembly transcriptional regulator